MNKGKYILLILTTMISSEARCGSMLGNMAFDLLCIVYTFFYRSNSYAVINKKESVELFVYLAIGIWRGPSTNKQYPTLVQYGGGHRMCQQRIQSTSDECYCLPCTLLKSPNFIAKDSETLSLKYVIGCPIPQS